MHSLSIDMRIMLKIDLFFHPPSLTLILHLTGEMLNFLVALLRKGNMEYNKFIVWTVPLFESLCSGVSM